MPSDTRRLQMRRWLQIFAIIAIVISIDQITKQIVIDTLLPYETYALIPALTPFFQITRTANTGSAFGFLPQAGDFFLIIALIVVIAMLIFYPRIPRSAHLTRFAVGLICGGALGNAIDRIRHDHVVDFIHYRIPDFISNVSNIADHAIVIGVLLVLYDSWRMERAEKRQALALAENPPGPHREAEISYNDDSE